MSSDHPSGRRVSPGYTLALVASSLALTVALWLDATLMAGSCYLLFTLAVLCVAAYHGQRLGLICTALIALAASLWVCGEPRPEAWSAPARWGQTVLFILVGSAVSYLCGHLRTGHAGRMAGARLILPPSAPTLPSQEPFLSLANAVSDIVFVATADGCVQLVNDRFYEYTGMASGSGLGDGWAAALHPEDRAHNQACWEQAADAGLPYQMRGRFRAADGSYHWFLGRSCPIHDPQGRIVQWLGVCAQVPDPASIEKPLWPGGQSTTCTTHITQAPQSSAVCP